MVARVGLDAQPRPPKVALERAAIRHDNWLVGGEVNEIAFALRPREQRNRAVLARLRIPNARLVDGDRGGVPPRVCILLAVLGDVLLLGLLLLDI